MESFFEGLMFFRAGDREEYIVSHGLDDVGHVSLRFGILTVESGSRGNLRTIAVVHPEGCSNEFTSDMQRYENLQMAAQALNSSYSATHAGPESAHVNAHVNTAADTDAVSAAEAPILEVPAVQAPVVEAPVVEVPVVEPVIEPAIEPAIEAVAAPAVESVVVAPTVSAPAVEPVPEHAPAVHTHVLEEEPVDVVAVEEVAPPAPKASRGRQPKGKRGKPVARKPAPKAPAVAPVAEPAPEPAEDDGVLAEVEAIMQPDPNK